MHRRTRSWKSKHWTDDSSSETLPEYQYKALQQDEIRILTLFPGEFNDDICMSLKHEQLIEPRETTRIPLTTRELQNTLNDDWEAHETLDGQRFFHHKGTMKAVSQHPDPDFDAELYAPIPVDPDPNFEPRYEALSYAWGSSKTPMTAYIIGDNDFKSTIRIGKRLTVALQHLRYSDQPRALWIDAICINQKDIQERNEQVIRMGLIYSLAFRVVNWLGPRGRDSVEAINTLKYIAQQVRVSRNGASFASANSVELEWYNPKFELQFDDSIWEALVNFLDQTWWTRMWTLQEILLANRHAILQCGPDELLFSIFQQSAACLDMNESIPKELRYHFFGMERVIYDGNQHLTRLLDNVHNRYCSDPRDKIYGILSVCPEEFRSKIQPNYSLAISEVYKQAFFAQLETTNRLEVFSHLDGEPMEYNLPSWVPNWNTTEKCNVSIRRKWRAAGLSLGEYHALDNETLAVTGVWCGEISDKTEPISQDREQAIESLSSWRPRTGADGNVSDQALWNALLMEEFSDYNPTSVLGYPSKSEWTELCKNNLQKAFETLPDLHFLSAYNSSAFATKEGHVGFGPSSLETGDKLCVLLGCHAPMILRPSYSGKYTVVGVCYIYGLTNGEALLGPLPSPWTIRYLKTQFEDRLSLNFFNQDTGETTLDDPRLEELPEEWMKVERERTGCDPEHVIWFEHKTTGQVINYDPRMNIEALKMRGVRLETLRLV